MHTRYEVQPTPGGAASAEDVVIEEEEKKQEEGAESEEEDADADAAVKATITHSSKEESDIWKNIFEKRHAVILIPKSTSIDPSSDDRPKISKVFPMLKDGDQENFDTIMLGHVIYKKRLQQSYKVIVGSSHRHTREIEYTAYSPTRILYLVKENADAYTVYINEDAANAANAAANVPSEQESSMSTSTATSPSTSTASASKLIIVFQKTDLFV